ncbi:hypothetical protein EVAR_43481_1 [Eumeta japonica]|uniref:Uncharacterized protein n=1 Tax=Eumeta variegata TaxID=151549 RepID=A0A4C1YMK5_EUMVA|nr:hypothetical protein EVAR_43481_1 [Eumeta japonica]
MATGLQRAVRPAARAGARRDKRRGHPASLLKQDTGAAEIDERGYKKKISDVVKVKDAYHHRNVVSFYLSVKWAQACVVYLN